jgi:flagellar secretion chaperone FliS
MSYARHSIYVESEILSAPPADLIRMLYRGAIGAVSQARLHLETGDIAGRSSSISKAVDILNELNASLSDEGGELSITLAMLYGYMQRRLLQANIDQDDAPLEEIQKLLATISEAWDTALPPTQLV